MGASRGAAGIPPSPGPQAGTPASAQQSLLWPPSQRTLRKWRGRGGREESLLTVTPPLPDCPPPAPDLPQQRAGDRAGNQTVGSAKLTSSLKASRVTDPVVTSPSLHLCRSSHCSLAGQSVSLHHVHLLSPYGDNDPPQPFTPSTLLPIRPPSPSVEVRGRPSGDSLVSSRCSTSLASVPKSAS